MCGPKPSTPIPKVKASPRIRHWKELNLCRPPGEHRYLHIDSLFNTQAEWHLIETMLPDMLRVAMSIKAGTIRPSTILRRLATYSRKNKLYFAFRELGRVVRTIFLLQYVSDLELRQVIQAATNKSEAFNKFVQWVCFGGEGVITENVRDEQRKFIKYNHLVANLLSLHTLVTMTKALQQLLEEGHTIDMEALSTLSPYRTEHINRFGNYVINPNECRSHWNSAWSFHYHQSRLDRLIRRSVCFLPESLPPSFKRSERAHAEQFHAAANRSTRKYGSTPG
jgi:hypothetical protein